MEGKVKAIPEGYHAVTPYLIVNDATGAIDFYKRAFGAVEETRMERDGKVAHAEIRMGDSRIMLADEMPGTEIRSPRAIGGTPIFIMIYVEDVDAVVARAVEAGATLQRPVKDQFYGDRSGSVEDPYGHIWHVATHKEDLTPEEIRRRAALVN